MSVRRRAWARLEKFADRGCIVIENGRCFCVHPIEVSAYEVPNLTNGGVLGCRNVGVDHGYHEWALRSSAYNVVSRRAYCLCKR